MPKRTHKIGDIVEITWEDCCGFINTPLSKVVIHVAKNMGKLIAEEESYYILQTGIYPESDEKEGDYTIIPKGWEQSIEVIGRLK